MISSQSDHLSASGRPYCRVEVCVGCDERAAECLLDALSSMAEAVAPGDWVGGLDHPPSYGDDDDIAAIWMREAEHYRERALRAEARARALERALLSAPAKRDEAL